jgi:hypothetical protein
MHCSGHGVFKPFETELNNIQSQIPASQKALRIHRKDQQINDF